MVDLEAASHANGRTQEGRRIDAQAGLVRGGLRPTEVFERTDAPYPMLRYAYDDTRAALASLAAARPHGEAVLMSFINPYTGQDVQNILGFGALMLRPGESVRLPARSPASVFHLIEGRARVQVDMPHSPGDFLLEEADTCCAPGYCPIELSNPSGRDAAVLFIADESPLHRKLGLYEIRN